ARRIATMEPDRLDAAFRERPALHRFPGNMAKRTRALCAYLVDRYDGDASRIWREARDGADLHARLLDLPGFGPMKAGTLIAILGKRLGVAPAGWKAYSPDHMTPVAVADLSATARVIDDDAERRQILERVARAWRRTDVDRMVEQSPLIEVTIDEPTAGAARPV